jgi:hypothetical protein
MAKDMLGRGATALAFLRRNGRAWCALIVVSCARRAPGPEECHALAVQWVAREPSVVSRRWGNLVLEPADSRVLDRTTECLTVPYDRELVSCVGSGAPPRLCLGAFEARRGGARPALQIP